MKRFLTLTAIIEAATGLALIALPAIVVRLLLGGEISGASIPFGRVAGAALLALGVACWLARDDTQSRATRGVVIAMLMYNLVATAVFAFAGIGLGLHGSGVVACGSSPRGDGRLVCRLPAKQFLSDDGDRAPLHSPKVPYAPHRRRDTIMRIQTSQMSTGTPV